MSTCWRSILSVSIRYQHSLRYQNTSTDRPTVSSCLTSACLSAVYPLLHHSGSSSSPDACLQRQSLLSATCLWLCHTFIQVQHPISISDTYMTANQEHAKVYFSQVEEVVVCVSVVGLLSRLPVQEEVMVLLLALCGPSTLCWGCDCSVPPTSTSTSETLIRSVCLCSCLFPFSCQMSQSDNCSQSPCGDRSAPDDQKCSCSVALLWILQKLFVCP